MPINLGSLMIWGFVACFALVVLAAAMDQRQDDAVFPKVSLKQPAIIDDIDASLARR